MYRVIISKYDIVVSCIDLFEFLSKVSIILRIWVVYWLIWIEGICRNKFIYYDFLKVKIKKEVVI